jgi:hypothetical protein
MRNNAYLCRAAVAGLAVVFSAASAGAACLKDNTDGQIAEGTLTVQRAEDLAGRPERPFILRLKADACLDTKDPEDAVKATRTSRSIRTMRRICLRSSAWSARP